MFTCVSKVMTEVLQNLIQTSGRRASRVESKQIKYHFSSSEEETDDTKENLQEFQLKICYEMIPK